MLNSSATEFRYFMLTATPVPHGLIGAGAAGHLTDRYGGRIVMVILMAITVPAIWLMSYATEHRHFW